MSARWPHEGPTVPEQRPLPATLPRVPRGMWKRIAQETIVDLFWARREIERLRNELAAAKAAKEGR